MGDIKRNPSELGKNYFFFAPNIYFKLGKYTFHILVCSSQTRLISSTQSWAYSHRSSSASQTHYKIDPTAQRREYSEGREAQERSRLTMVQNSAVQGFDMFA